MSLLAAINEARKDFPVEWQRERRIEYLEGVIQNLRMSALHEIALHRDYVKRNRLVEMMLTQERLDGLLVNIIRAENEIAMLRRPERPGRNTITPEMIEQARAIPSPSSISLSAMRPGVPFMRTRTPSFILLKDNRAQVFRRLCKDVGYHQFLMDKEGLRFPEAVRQLQ